MDSPVDDLAADVVETCESKELDHDVSQPTSLPQVFCGRSPVAGLLSQGFCRRSSGTGKGQSRQSNLPIPTAARCPTAGPPRRASAGGRRSAHPGGLGRPDDHRFRSPRRSRPRPGTPRRSPSFRRSGRPPAPAARAGRSAPGPGRPISGPFRANPLPRRRLPTGRFCFPAYLRRAEMTRRQAPTKRLLPRSSLPQRRLPHRVRPLHPTKARSGSALLALANLSKMARPSPWGPVRSDH